MSTIWTKNTKPSGTSWTNINAPSKHTYDESQILYDDSVIEYDGDILTGWSKVTKITGTVWSKITKAT